MLKLMVVFIMTFILLACSKSEQSEPEGQVVPQENLVMEADTTISFDTDEVGEMPAGWSNYLTGKGKLGKWGVRQDQDNNVLVQASQENFGYHFDVIVWEESNYKDLQLSVKFKGVEGKKDQGGGPVWRYQDADNYYIARANPLENNFRVYKVVNGNRKQLASAGIKVTSGEWNTISIKMVGNHIECFYDGKKHLDVTDDTFKSSGKIGLWTKADAVTYFDDLQIGKIQ